MKSLGPGVIYNFLCNAFLGLLRFPYASLIDKTGRRVPLLLRPRFFSSSGVLMFRAELIQSHVGKGLGCRAEFIDSFAVLEGWLWLERSGPLGHT